MSSTVRTKRASRQKNAPKSSRNDQQRRGHRSTLTCNNCRARKTKCDGTQPGCKTCEVYNDQCRYEKPPPMSQIIAMSQRLQEYEQIIESMREKETTIRSTASPAMQWDDTRSQSQSQSQSEHEHGTSGVIVYQSSKNGLNSDNSGPMLVSAERLSDLSLDENGKLCYYGPTSAVHDPPALQGQDLAGSSTNLISNADMHSSLVSGARESRAWEDFALGNATIEMGLPRETVSKLLQLHWSWIAPLFMWVYRPAFMRDMITGGQYFSQFLLVVLCAHSSRFQDSSIGEILISRARLLLGQEIQKPSSIPTVQALLQLSARELAYGSISQAWLYSGMAFRMVSDLGLHRTSENVARLGRLTAEDLEIRRRLFWSCYFWDKAISLYLGRLPALTELPLGHEPKLFDDSTADDLWAPYYVDAVSDDSNPPDAYPPMKSHAVSCFENSCKLAVIMNQIILQLYSRGTLSATDSTLQAIREQLDNWRANSPDYLRYDPDNLEGVCCPPHILTQNLLYYTTIILLHRPFSSSPIHYAACRQAASSIEKLLLFLERSFGFTRITYLMAYCIYTGASTIIPDVKLGDVVARASMNTFLRALKGGCTTCPVVQRSINIIMNSLEEDGMALNDDDITQLQANPAIDDSNTANLARNYPPAFPHNDWQFGTGFDPVGSSSLMDSDALFLLECFPENHIGSGGSEWYMP